MKRQFIVILSLSIFSFVMGFLREFLLSISPETFIAIAFTPSIYVTVSSLYIRFFCLNANVIDEDLRSSDLLDGGLNPNRFYNMMPLAAITCTIADIIIVFSIIGGVISFLIAQILFTIAYSGIIHFKFYNNSNKINKNVCIILLVWTIIPIILFFLFIFKPDNFLSYFVIPYIFLLALNGLITSFGVLYSKRNVNLRLFLMIGSISFFISDSILGYSIFNGSFLFSNYMVGITYILAIVLIQHAIIFSTSNK